MSYSPTKQNLLTPRDCRHCGQHMSEELLKERMKNRYRPDRYRKRSENKALKETIDFMCDKQGLNASEIWRRLNQNGVKITYRAVRYMLMDYK